MPPSKIPPASSRFNNGDAQMIDQFNRDLESTTEQVEKLLDTVRTGQLDFAAIKIELRILCENVKEISSLLRDGEGGASLITRVILLERKIKEIESNIEKDFDKKEADRSSSQKSLADIVLADKNGKWGLRIAMATGIIGLLASIISVLLK